MAESSKKEKSSIGELYMRIAKVINKEMGRMYPDFSKDVVAIEISQGFKKAAEASKNGTVKLLPDEELLGGILRYCHDRLDSSAYKWTYSQAEACLKLWKAYTTPIQDPKWVAWKDEDCYAYNRLPWTKQRGATPYFDTLMNRLSNREAVKTFIGSLFFPESDRQQYLWIYGKGGEGKGTLMRFLDRVFNDCYAAENVPTMGDKFWTSNFYQKRLVVFEDCNNSRFVTSAQFKSLTGNDKIKVEEKGEKAFYCRIPSKFIFISNVQPSISNKNANIRRLIYSEIEPLATPQDPGFEAKLWSEGGFFISECMDLYLKNCPLHSVIPSDESSKETIIANANDVDSDFDVIFDRYFEKSISGCVSSRDWGIIKLKEFASSRSTEAQDFANWMAEQKGVKKTFARSDDGRNTRVLKGIKVKDTARSLISAGSLPTAIL